MSCIKYLTNYIKYDGLLTQKVPVKAICLAREPSLSHIACTGAINSVKSIKLQAVLPYKQQIIYIFTRLIQLNSSTGQRERVKHIKQILAVLACVTHSLHQKRNTRYEPGLMFTLEMNIRCYPDARAYSKRCLKRLLIKTATFLCMLAFYSNASANSTEYRIKAAYLYQFTKFTQWPAHLFSEKDAPIRICILGKNPFGTLLDNFTRKTSQQRTLTITYLSSFQNLSNCHVIFISKSEENRLTQILRKVENSPILTVSDIDNFVQRGGIIGFIPRHKKVKIAINVRASRTAGAKLSSKLLEVATLVHNRTGESAQ